MCLNNLEVGSLTVLLLMLLDEMAESLRVEYQKSNGQRRVEESISLALIFVTVPAILYIFFLIKYLR